MSARAQNTTMAQDQFLAWYREQPEGARYELLNGVVYPRAPDRRRHARAKCAVYTELIRAVTDTDCEVFADGLGVSIPDNGWLVPDASVECGAPDNPDDTFVTPCVVVEVTSPGAASIDTSSKMHGYFLLDSVVHYLVVSLASQSVIVHTRKNQRITTTIHTDSQLQLIMPDIQIDVGHFFTRPSR